MRQSLLPLLVWWWFAVRACVCDRGGGRAYPHRLAVGVWECVVHGRLLRRLATMLVIASMPSTSTSDGVRLSKMAVRHFGQVPMQNGPSFA